MAPHEVVDEIRIADNLFPLPTIDKTNSGLIGRLGNLFGLKESSLSARLPDDDDKQTPEQKTGIANAVREIVSSFIRIGPKSAATLAKVREAALLKEDIDDRDYVMEQMIQAVVKDANGTIGHLGTKTFIETLWNDLPHPPDSSLGGPFKFRKADGSNTSLINPNMGAAGQYYARTVKPNTIVPADLPDPAVLFDSLLAREKPKDHPNKISSVLFYLATVIIHDIFRTDHRDFAKSKTSSYLDLAPLYGSSDAELATVRARDGKGAKLKPDCFAETRLLMLPPGSGILLIMFNRFHNSVADRLVAINENNRFRAKEDDPQEIKDAFDEETFQTARLITCGLYVNLILIDYVRTILNLNRTDSNWQLDPRLNIDGGPIMGVGNQVSAEFSLVYRWHATVSDRDDIWTQDKFKELFDGRSAEQVPMPELLRKLGEVEAKTQRQLPEERAFENFKRETEGPRKDFYRDEDLVKSLTDSSDDCANAYGPRQIPTVLKAVEILGIKQARSWNLATLNEFRRHFDLKAHEDWSDITTDKIVAGRLKDLYKSVDNVELYPGLAVEDAKEPMLPGSGLCPNYTVSRAVLSDAVALVRGDRFYTTAYHPRITTNWGFAEAGADTDVDNGCVFYKLFQTAFPHHIHDDSIYSHYPLTQAAEVRDKILPHHLSHKQHFFNTEKVTTNVTSKQHLVSLPKAVKSILEDPSLTLDLSLAIKFLSPSKRSNSQFKGLVTSFLQSGPRVSSSVSQPLLVAMCSEFEKDLSRHIKEKSYRLPKFQEVDMVRDVVSKSAIRLSALIFDLPVGEGPTKLTEQEFDHIFTTTAASWTNFDRTRLTALRQKNWSLVKRLREAMIPSLEQQRSAVAKSNSSALPVKRYHNDVLASAFKTLDVEGVFAATVMLASSFATTISSSFSEILNHLLSLEPSHLKTIQNLTSSTPSSSSAPLTAYIHELLRLSSTTPSLRTATHTTTLSLPNNRTVSIPESDLLLLSPHILNSNAATFPDPTTLNTDRDAALYLPPSLSIGATDASWQELHLACLRSLLKVVCALPGLRPATVYNGVSGPAALKKIPAGHGRLAWGEEVGDGVDGKEGDEGKEGKDGGKRVVQTVYLDEKWEYLAPFPRSLKVNWDLD